ncbi:MAG: glycosyl transferase [Syntrophus sp. (in: bacteria)]|nr:glycosyl transferase [Syntrophus sp. (in: bacteria)]
MKTSYQDESVLFHEILISIVLPVYNGAKYLRDAIDSMLAQSYANFELIIIDDGSTDDSINIVSAFTGPRIRLYSQTNQGLAATLNKGIALAKGEYIARQDQDDVSLPDRLSKQVAFLEANPDYGMVGTWASIWEETKPTERFHKHPADNLSLKFDLLFDNAFVHSSLMIRKTVFDEVGVYCTDPNRQPPEDYELWSRVARKFRIANIPEVLHVYREMPQSMSRTGSNPFLQNLLKINVENLAWATEGRYSNQSLQDLAALIHGAYQYFSRETSWRELVSIVREAARVLCDYESARYDTIQDKVRFRINSLRYHYNQAMYFGFLGDSGRRALMSIFRVGKTLFQKTWGTGLK